MILIVGIVLLLITLLFLKHNFNKKFNDIAKIPGPPVKNLFGNIDVFGKSPAETFQNQLSLVKEYGPFVRIWLGTKLMILLADPDKIENILSSQEHISKSEGYDGFKPWLGNGLINSSGDHWRFHRKLLTPTFHFKILNIYTQVVNSNCKVLISKLKNHAGEKSLDIHPLLTSYNLDLISEAAMNTKISELHDRKTEYVEALHRFLTIHTLRLFSMLTRFDFIFKFTRDYIEQKASIHKLKQLTNDIIKARKEDRRRGYTAAGEDEFGIKNKSAFLDLLLDMDNSVLTDEEIREEVDTFMFGGHHTLSSAATFCLLELSKHPDIQTRLFEESVNILGTDKNMDLTMQNINNMTYLDMVVKEALRFHAPVPFIERSLQSDIEIEGLRIPKGTTAVLLIYAMHRSEKHYPNPDKFDPDRFLPENSATRHPYAYIPFSAGPRNCIGQRFALLATKALIIQIVRNFEILPAEPKFKPILSNVCILQSDNGICVQLKLRK